MLPSSIPRQGLAARGGSASAASAGSDVGRSAGRPDRAGDARYLALAELLARWMDRRYIDPIIGLVLPGAGDAIGAGIGLLGIYAAFRLRAHPVVIARMFINLALDSVFGAIPVLGAVIDFFYRAHTRNLVLLRNRDDRASRPSDWLVVGAAALLFLAALALPIIVVIFAVSLLR